MEQALDDRIEELLNNENLRDFLRDALYILLDPSKNYSLVILYNDLNSHIVARFLSNQLVDLSGSDKELSTPLFFNKIKPKRIIPYIYKIDDGDNYSSLISNYDVLKENRQNLILIASTSGELPTDCGGKAGVYTCDVNYILNKR